MPIHLAIPSAVTNAERAYEYLRRVAIDFVLRPGERLNEGEIAQLLDMSRAPVREAMNRLVSEGLLTSVPNKGFSCRRLSASEILALYEVRGDLEVCAVASLRAPVPPQALAELDQLARSMRQNFGQEPLDTLLDQDEEFHLRLAALAGNEERLGILRHINARIRFVRRVNLEDPVRAPSMAEHLQIVAALGAGDTPAAARLLRSHLTLIATEVAAAVNLGLTRIYAPTVT
jgi:DNA-binding GntR family transcriptional regulator